MTHLIETLQAYPPIGSSYIIIWALEILFQNPCTKIYYQNLSKILERNIFFRIYWHMFYLEKVLKKYNCNILFAPGGSVYCNFKPLVVVSQNLLPFCMAEIKRYGFSLISIKWLLLRLSQSNTFKKADGVIFLTNYAKKTIESAIGKKIKACAIVPHGISERFRLKPVEPESELSQKKVLNLIYVSTIDFYKHQWNVIDAIHLLRQKHGPFLKLILLEDFITTLTKSFCFNKLELIRKKNG